MYRFFPSSYLFFLLFWPFFSLNSYAETEPDQQTAFSVRIDEKIQTEAGIQTQKLIISHLTPELKTFAVRVDLAPLIKTRSEYLLAYAEQAALQSKLEQAQRNVQRSSKLLGEKAISSRKLHEQKTLLKVVQIQLNSAQQQLDNLLLHSQLKWGKELCKIFLTKGLSSTSIQDMLDHPLYLIHLPIQNTTINETVYIHAFAIRELAQTATLVANAPAAITEKQQGGRAFYYLSDQISTEQHHRVAAWIPLAGKKLSGILIPTASVVWHLGESYVYLKLETELFKRLKITDKRLISQDSYFTRNTLQLDDVLVTTGAQLLLSEEFRGQIPDEDDD